MSAVRRGEAASEDVKDDDQVGRQGGEAHSLAASKWGQDMLSLGEEETEVMERYETSSVSCKGGLLRRFEVEDG